MTELNSKLIVEYMTKHNLSQEQLAELCDVPVSIIRKFVKGKGNFLAFDLMKISLVTKIKCDDLLCLHT